MIENLNEEIHTEDNEVELRLQGHNGTVKAKVDSFERVSYKK